MRVYTVHLRRHGLDPDRDLVLVREGFSWPAFFLTVLWALWNRMWWVAAGILAAQGVLNLLMYGLGPDPATQFILSVGLSAVVGIVANDLRRRVLDRRGFAFVGVVSGDGRDAALRRYLDSDPRLARELNL